MAEGIIAVKGAQNLRDFFSGKRVVVTGGAGAIGSNLVQILVHLGCEVSVVDDLSSGHLKNLCEVEDQMDFIKADIAHPEVWQEIRPGEIDLVFHLAAFFANQNSVDFPEKDLATNGMGTLNLCRWAVEAGVKRLVFISSSCVYGMAGGKIREEQILDPHTPYAMTKVLGEQYIRFFHEYHGLDAVILRYFNSFGPGEYPGNYRNVIPNFIDKALRGEALTVTGTGAEMRDFTFVQDTIRGTLLAGMIQEASGQAFNIGTGCETRIDDLARLINEFTGNSSGITYCQRREWDRIPRRCANIDKARDILGYRPGTSLEEGLGKTYRWFLQAVSAQTQSSVAIGL